MKDDVYAIMREFVFADITDSRVIVGFVEAGMVNESYDDAMCIISMLSYILASDPNVCKRDKRFAIALDAGFLESFTAIIVRHKRSTDNRLFTSMQHLIEKTNQVAHHRKSSRAIAKHLTPLHGLLKFIRKSRLLTPGSDCSRMVQTIYFIINTNHGNNCIEKEACWTCDKELHKCEIKLCEG